MTYGAAGMLGALAGSDASAPIPQSLVVARSGGEAALRQRLEQATLEGDLPEQAKVAALNAFIMTLLSGMAVQAKTGADRATLDAVAAQALSTWPGQA